MNLPLIISLFDMFVQNILSYSIKYLIILIFIEKFQIINGGKPEWLSDLLDYIHNNFQASRQVVLITSESDDAKIDNYWINMMLTETMSYHPTFRVNENSIINNEKSYDKETNSTGTLYIFVSDVSTPCLHSPKKIMNIMKALSLNVIHVNYLMIMLSRNWTDNFDELLRYSWKQEMNSLTIMELLHCNETIGIIKNTCDHYVPFIYNYNPFLNLIIKRNYVTGIDWFPNFINNMHNYPVNVAIKNKQPFSLVNWDENFNYKSMKGLDIYIMKEIAKRMNFTPKILPKLEMKYNNVLKNRTVFGLFEVMKSGEIDLLASLSPHYTQELEENSFRTDMILIDELCPLTPIIKVVEIPFSVEIIEALILTVGIVTIFCIATNLFRFDKSWNVFLTIRILFGIPVSDIYKKFSLSQRSLIQTLIMISLFYSANIYSSLTKVSIDTDSEIDISTFEDIDNSGLVPVISPYLWNKTFSYIGNNEEILLKIKKKTKMGPITRICVDHAQKYKNSTCLLPRLAGKLFMKQRIRNGKPTLKLVKQCFWFDSYTFLVKRGSPYRKRINELLVLFSEVGLKLKWYEQNKRDFNISDTWNQTPDVFEELEEPKGVLKKQLMAVLLFGMSAATIVFIGELLWFYGTKKLRK